MEPVHSLGQVSIVCFRGPNRQHGHFVFVFRYIMQIRRYQFPVIDRTSIFCLRLSCCNIFVLHRLSFN